MAARGKVAGQQDGTPALSEGVPQRLFYLHHLVCHRAARGRDVHDIANFML
jgi:hypothetical protein